MLPNRSPLITHISFYLFTFVLNQLSFTHGVQTRLRCMLHSNFNFVTNTRYA